MNGGVVPLLLISVTVGLMLAFTPGRLLLYGLGAFAVAALAGFLAPVIVPLTTVFVALWLSLIATALLLYFPSAWWRLAILPLAINAGLWLGACASLTSSAIGFATSLLPALVAIPAKWIAQGKFDIIIKVVASWMIAIASLSLFVSLIPTPGYKPDHME